MFLIALFLLFSPIIHAGQEANFVAEQVLSNYGRAIEKSNEKEFYSLLDDSYEFYPCGSYIDKFNRDKIWETVKFMPQGTIKLSKRTLIDAGLSGDKKLLRIKVNLGGYTDTTFDAKLKDGRYVIFYEQQDNCRNEHHLATTYMIDYNGTAYLTAKVLLGKLFESSRRSKEKLLGYAMALPFTIYYFENDSRAVSQLKKTIVTRETVQVEPYDYIKEVEHCSVKVTNAYLCSNRSVTFDADGEYFVRSTFDAAPKTLEVDGVVMERHYLIYQYFVVPLSYTPTTLPFHIYQYMYIEKDEEDE